MQNTDIRHLLEGYNTAGNFVLASENDHIIFSNNAATELIGINVLGEPICSIIGEDAFRMVTKPLNESVKIHETISVADCDFFGTACILNAFVGSPSLYIFTPQQDNNNEYDIEFSPSSLLGFATEARKQISPLLFSDASNTPSVTKCGYQIIRLISNFSDYIRLGSQTPMLYSMNTDIVSLCKEIVSSAGSILDIVEIPISFDTQHNSCVIMTDSQLIRRAVMNLICNSAKYTRIGNKIDVSLRFSADQCFLKVSDNGTGISPSDISGIFRTFKAHQYPRLSGGFGLGLALVRRIALLHGGNAVLASKENYGTDVTISLPVYKKRAIKADEIVVGSSFDSALLELSEVLTADEFKSAYERIHTKKRGSSNS